MYAQSHHCKCDILSASRRSAIEPLEDRVLMSTYRVTTLGDSAGVVTQSRPGHFNATTLRAAMTAANSHSGADSITFARDATGQIQLKSALPRIEDDLTITGGGRKRLAVRRSAQASTNFSIFYIESGKRVTISNLTVADGTGTPVNENSPEYGRYGGGIYNAGNLTVADCTIAGNTARAPATAFGGGIYNDYLGQLSVFRSTISGNTARGGGDARGGGICSGSEQAIVLTDCTVTGNQAIGGSNSNSYDTGSASGGGIQATSATLSRCIVGDNHAFTEDEVFGQDYSFGGGMWCNTATLDRCWFTGNTATGTGGAVECYYQLTATHTTFSKNKLDWRQDPGVPEGGAVSANMASLSNCTLTGTGAGFAVFARQGLTLTNCTIVRNAGGGVFVDYYHEEFPLSINNSILAENGGYDLDHLAPDFGGASLGYNLLGSVNGVALDGQPGNRVGVTASQLKLAHLADNGGKAWTIALLPGSIAIDAGSTPRAVGHDGPPLRTDERGDGFARVIGARVDVGAFEVQ